MRCLSDNVEFRGSEKKEIVGDDGKKFEMTVFRFDDESGLQNEFYVMQDKLSDVVGVSDIVRGGVYQVELSIGKSNKVKLLGVYEK